MNVNWNGSNENNLDTSLNCQGITEPRTSYSQPFCQQREPREIAFKISEDKATASGVQMLVAAKFRSIAARSNQYADPVLQAVAIGINAQETSLYSF
jgi:hypothetical protein